MRALIQTALLFLCVLLLSVPASASGDDSCYPAMKLFHPGFTGCDSMGFLAPGNDTRINLIYLMADARKQKLEIQFHDKKRYPQPGDFTPSDWQNFSDALKPEMAADATTQETIGEGTICVSDAKGSAQFLAAVAAATDVPDPEKKALTEVRLSINCAKGALPYPAAQKVLEDLVQSAPGKDFLAYLNAITQFYGGHQFDSSSFAAMTNAKQPWVKEAASYMQARTLLLDAQASAFDDYGTIQKDKIVPAAVSKAHEALDGYLKDYPGGTYAASATGLLRRVYWLGADQSKQLEAYASFVASKEVNEASLDVVNEMDFKLPIEAFNDSSANTMVLAVQDFRLMREQTDGDGKPAPGMKADVLEAQRPRFATAPDLFDYLLAARAWFIDHDAKAVLSLLHEKPISENLTYLEFSRQLLRAAALDASNDEAARPAYVAMFAHAQSAYQRSTLELALAMSDERHKKIGPDFDADTLIQDPTIRKQLITYVAGPIILRQQATAATAPQEERDTALFTLLSRDLVQGRFKGFLDDIKLMPPVPVQPADPKQEKPSDPFEAFRWEGRQEGYLCPATIEIAKTLVANPQDVRGRICLGDLFRLKAIGDTVLSDKDLLGGTGTLFSGKALSRQDFYIDIMKDKKASPDDRAYALFRAVHCYEPVGNNSCGGPDVPVRVRKAWHDELKANYGTSNWAKALHYYW